MRNNGSLIQSRLDRAYSSLDLLCFVTDPEEKRRIIGDTFMDVAKRCVASVPLSVMQVSQALASF